MSAGISTTTVLNAASVAISFLGVMAAFWSFGHARPGWGVYNLVIAVPSLLTFIAVRAHTHKT